MYKFNKDEVWSSGKAEDSRTRDCEFESPLERSFKMCYYWQES